MRAMARLQRLASILVVALLASVTSGSVTAQAPDPLAALNAQVLKLYREGKYSEATEIAKQSLALAERKFGPDHPDVGTSLNDLAALYRAQGRTAEAEPLYKRSLALREKALGPDHPWVGQSLNNLAELYESLGRYVEAEPLYKRSLALAEKALGPDHPWVGTSLNNLALLYRAQGRTADAELLCKRSLALREKALGPDHPDVGQSLNNLAGLYWAQGRYAEAEPVYKRSLALREKALGPDHPDVGQSLNNLAELYRAQGRYAEAEPLYKRSLALAEKALGPEHPDVGTSLNNLASLYESQGRYAETEPLFKRSLALREKALGPDHPDVGQSLNDLAELYRAQGRTAEAEPLSKRTVTIFEKALGPDHPWVGTSLNNLALLYRAQERYAEAEPLLNRSLALREKALGPDHPDVGNSLNNLAELYESQSRYVEAEPISKRSLALREKALGPDHPDVGNSLNNLAWLSLGRNDLAGAADRWRRATAVLQRRAERGLGDASGGSSKGEAQRNSGYFAGLVKTTQRLAVSAWSDPLGLTPALKMFEAAQWAVGSEAAASLAQMAARSAGGSPQLAALVRERQDLVGEWQGKDKLLIAARSQQPARRNAAAETALADRLAAIDARFASIDQQLGKDFPEYAALANPKPIGVTEVQAQLRHDEALVLFLDTVEFKPLPEETFVWVVTKRDVRWVRSELGTTTLTEAVAHLRKGLDPTSGGVRGALLSDPGKAQVDAFDTNLAHELYSGLLEPVEDLIRDKTHLIVVPSGPLTGLPFHLLVTEEPRGGSEQSNHSKTPWLVRRHAITTLPSVASLAALRRTTGSRPAPKPFLAFADPIFRPGTATVSLRRGDQPTTRGFADYFRGVNPDAAALSALRPLPDTADEVRAIAKTLGDGALLRLGRDATETEIKRLPLDQYRVVHFATHGLVASEIKALAEPALALSGPVTPTADDDGLLTASEVAALKLNAEWVILSACNTAAGDRPGAEALSGLARAFFYAGTKALLVSHWPVKSSAAVKLTTGTFDALAREPAIGRAEALRRAMLAMIDAGGPDAQPSSWAPFVVVGEGGAAR